MDYQKYKYFDKYEILAVLKVTGHLDTQLKYYLPQKINSLYINDIIFSKPTKVLNLLEYYQFLCIN
jgi:hypothetical protein